MCGGGGRVQTGEAPPSSWGEDGSPPLMTPPAPSVLMHWLGPTCTHLLTIAHTAVAVGPGARASEQMGEGGVAGASRGGERFSDSERLTGLSVGGLEGGGGWNDFPSFVVMSTCLSELLLVAFRLCDQSRTVNETPPPLQPRAQ